MGLLVQIGMRPKPVVCGNVRQQVASRPQPSELATVQSNVYRTEGSRQGASWWRCRGHPDVNAAIAEVEEFEATKFILN
jgi:hypothetical protein